MPLGRLRSKDRKTVLAGLLCLASILLFWATDPAGLARTWRENAFDILLSWSPRNSAISDVVVVDIDREALQKLGPWPWPRDRLALLVHRISEAKPKVLGIDILLAEKKAGADSTEDQLLAQAISNVPTVLGIVLDPKPSTDSLPSATIAADENIRLTQILFTAGMVTPAAHLQEQAQGFGVITLPAPDGEPVRTVPLLARGGNSIVSGLAVEMLRIATGAGALVVRSPPQTLQIAEYTLPLPIDGLLRLHFSPSEHRNSRKISAGALISGEADSTRLTNKIVLLGASAPEAGGLRLTAIDGFTPSVDIQAEATEQILAGQVPLRMPWMINLEIIVGLLLGATSIVAFLLLSPGRAALIIGALSVLWLIVAVNLSLKAAWLTDPINPLIAGLFTAQVAGLTQFFFTYRQRLSIERRFAHHLPAAVVRRIADNPDELRVAGESRTITVLSTDIEGFTAMTERLKPEELVGLLDRYIDLVVGIVVEHGGMVDKLIGDAVLAYFNAPLDLPDFAEEAVSCANAIVQATEELRRDEDIAKLGLGRTRIGIETGVAVLGEVGRGSKRDYTAYGHPVNMASRLEQINKQFGSSIAIGPVTAAAIKDKVPLQLLGSVPIRGVQGNMDVFTPKAIQEK